jgi:hypothetical protein
MQLIDSDRLEGVSETHHSKEYPIRYLERHQSIKVFNRTGRFMQRFTIALVVMSIIVTAVPSVNSESNECDFDSTIACNHFTDVSSTESMDTQGIVDFEISGDGDLILYSDSEKYNLIDVETLSIIASDYLMPNQTIGLDGRTGLLMVYGGEDCFFPGQGQACKLNETYAMSPNNENPENYYGAHHSDEYIICEVTDTVFFGSECDHRTYVYEDEKEGKVFSPNGQYEIWFTSYLVDEDNFGVDDYDGVVTYGEVLSWEIVSQNSTIPKSITRVLGGFKISSSSKDDVNSILWAHDSKYAYVITCKEIYGVDVIEHTVESIGSPPFECDSSWWDDQIGYIGESAKISLDGSTIVYRVGSDIAIVQLDEEWGPGMEEIIIGGFVLIVLVIFVVIVMVLRSGSSEYEDDDDEDGDYESESQKPAAVGPSEPGPGGPPPSAPVKEDWMTDHRVDDDGIEWAEDENGSWWYRDPGASDWGKWPDSESDDGDDKKEKTKEAWKKLMLKEKGETQNQEDEWLQNLMEEIRG